MRNATLLLALAAPAAAAGAAACAAGAVAYGAEYEAYKARGGCRAGDAVLREKRSFFCTDAAWWKVWCMEEVCQPCVPGSGVHEPTGRRFRDLAAEEERKANALQENLHTGDDVDGEDFDGSLLQGDVWANLQNMLAVKSVESFLAGAFSTTKLAFAWVNVASSNVLFPFTNFVDGFRPGDKEADKWKKPVAGETVGVVSFASRFAHLKNDFSKDYPFFHRYYTGGRVPSWEDNEQHERGVSLLDRGIAAARAVGFEPITALYSMADRFAFDNEGIIKATWEGFAFLNARDVAMASNGVHGVKVVESYATKDTLGVLATDSVFSAHLHYDAGIDRYVLDLADLEKYAPLEGYMRIGGRAEFALRPDLNRLETMKLVFFNETYEVVDFADHATEAAYQNNQLVGWRKAEKAIIASLLALTNLVMHVKDLHLELAAAFQAVSVDAFAHAVDHPLSRLLRPFIHRSIQATNDNFKLLFDYNAAEFSLAPLPTGEQLKLIATFIEEKPLALEDLDMARYAADRNMPVEATGPDGFWRWHKRTAAVEALYEEMVECYLARNFDSEADLLADADVQAWWASMYTHLPALNRTDSAWASKDLTRQGLVNVLKVMTTWLSWVHEDVGHSAAAFVYNPVYTPMAVPADGKGIPFRMVSFNVAAYRGFVFLNRAKLLDAPPADWHSAPAGDKKCYMDFQAALTRLGETDEDFAQCGADGFYSCVDNVETAVSS